MMTWYLVMTICSADCMSNLNNLNYTYYEVLSHPYHCSSDT